MGGVSSAEPCAGHRASTALAAKLGFFNSRSIAPSLLAQDAISAATGLKLPLEQVAEPDAKLVHQLPEFLASQGFQFSSRPLQSRRLLL